MSLRKAAEAYGARESKTFFSFSKLNEWYAAGMKENAVIPNPGIEDYPEKDRGSDLERHVKAREGKPFHVVRELLDYCMADVDVLLDVMLNFHTLFSRIVYDLSHANKGKYDGDETREGDIMNRAFWSSPFSQMTLAAAAFNTFKMTVYNVSGRGVIMVARIFTVIVPLFYRCPSSRSVRRLPPLRRAAGCTRSSS